MSNSSHIISFIRDSMKLSPYPLNCHIELNWIHRKSSTKPIPLTFWSSWKYRFHRIIDSILQAFVSLLMNRQSNKIDGINILHNFRLYCFRFSIKFSNVYNLISINLSLNSMLPDHVYVSFLFYIALNSIEIWYFFHRAFDKLRRRNSIKIVLSLGSWNDFFSNFWIFWMIANRAGSWVRRVSLLLFCFITICINGIYSKQRFNAFYQKYFILDIHTLYPKPTRFY